MEPTTRVSELWLGQFDQHRPVRAHPPLRLFQARREADGASVGVLVSAAEADPDAARERLAELFEKRRKLEPALLPPLGPPARIGELDYLTLDFPLSDDVEALSAGMARRGESLPYAAGEALWWALLEAIEVAHGSGLRVGALDPGQLLVAADGTPYWLPTGLSQAGGPRTAQHDWQAFTALVKRLRRFFPPPAELAAALRGEPAPNWAVESVAAFERADPAQCLDATGLRELLRARHSRLGIEPSMTTWRAAVAPALAHAAADRARLAHSRSLAGEGHGERYVLGDALGRGRTGTVFRARDRQLQQDVAIKRLLTPDRAEDVERLLREVRMLRSVRHPHLVQGYELYEERRQLGAVMELVPGPTLAEECAAGRVTGTSHGDQLANVCEGVAELHRMGIVHRDIKPANIVLSPGRGAVLVDLGFAREANVPASADLTRTGQAFGHPRYRAPELGEGLPADAASDVYSLARVVLEALGGGHCASLHTAEGVPERLRTCLARALDTDPCARGTALEMALALRGAWQPVATAVRVRVRSDGSEFWLPDGEHVDLRRRVAPGRLLRRLATALGERPGRGVDRESLVEAGWPGEKISTDAARNRVYVGIAQLRKWGLRDVLTQNEGGYLLDPAGVELVAAHD